MLQDRADGLCRGSIYRVPINRTADLFYPNASENFRVASFKEINNFVQQSDCLAVLIPIRGTNGFSYFSTLKFAQNPSEMRSPRREQFWEKAFFESYKFLR